VGTTTIRSGGTVAPGNSIGTLHFSGNFVQDAGSIYQVEVNPNSNASDLIAVTGTATLANGAGLNVTRNPAGSYRLGAQYTILSATDGLSGTYTLNDTTTPVSTFLGLKSSYDANNAYLNVVQTHDLTGVVGTLNQQAVAGGLDSLPSSSVLLLVVLNSPTADAARDAFDQLSGEAQASAKGALLIGSLLVSDTTIDRLRNVFCTLWNERVELLGSRRRDFIQACHLPFLDHVHNLNVTENNARAVKVLEPLHGPSDAFDGPMVLFDHVVKILGLRNFDGRLALGVRRMKRRQIRTAFVDGHRLGWLLRA
jgi:hypothetical protein